MNTSDPVSTRRSHTARLDNGLQVVVLVDRRLPAVTHMVWYRNGAADDPAGKSGIAHFLEHLMFKGTARHPAGQVAALVAGVGGEENAFTSHDHTVYFQRVPIGGLDICMRYEADRMCNLEFAPEVVALERDVVLEERRMRVDADPEAMLDETLRASLFSTHPYGRPVIGWQCEIEALEGRDAQAYYHCFYRPENAIVLVAGDVEADAVVALAGDIYGGIARWEAPLRRARPAEPGRLGRRMLSLARPGAGRAVVRRLYPAPSYRTAAPGEAESFDVLSVLLGGGEGALLWRSLVIEKAPAVAAGAYYIGNALDETIFGLYVVPAAGIALARVERLLDDILSETARSGFAANDVEKAKARLQAEAIFAQDNPAALAHRYGSMLANGATVEDIGSWPGRIAAVTPDQVVAALRRLQAESCVTGYLDTGLAP